MAIPANIKTILDSNLVESVRVEFKESWNPEPILHTICAFANDIDNFYGRYVIVVMNDNYSFKGIDIKQFDNIQKEIIRYCKNVLNHYIYQLSI